MTKPLQMRLKRQQCREQKSYIHHSMSINLDVAVRRAVLTGVNQTAAEMNLQYAKDQNCDYVETTAHAGARPEHAVWQGKVFCLSGTDPNTKTSMKQQDMEQDQGYVVGTAGITSMHSFLEYQHWHIHRRC